MSLIIDALRGIRRLRPSLALLPLAVLIALPAQDSSAASRQRRQPVLKKVNASAAEVGEFANFAQWKDAGPFIDRMAEIHGFERDEVRAILSKVRFVEKAVQLIKPAPPGRPKNWQAYRARFVEPLRIQAGVEFWDRHADVLARAEEQYGVPAEIIVGIIGVETIYGRNTGNFRVMDALATLAFAYPEAPNRAARMDYFRGELENALVYAREEKLDPFTLLGSYAGAIGWPQFMPGSIRRFAVDFDGDQHINLRASPVDAIGSVANFLLQHGWNKGDPAVFPATVSDNDSWAGFLKQGLQARNSIDELAAGGVLPATTVPADLRYGLVDLQNGSEPTEYWIGTNNFFAITQYNRSFFYAMSVIELGKSVRVARSTQTSLR
ncbi:lytic murein transglycosylase B [Lacisediminimonas profundi]|uniref:lytic murein transglycosylase B n=1 Tax=Lacisediminimonas profundi TaxID=2603856 RepID=UPI00124B7B56|nr:lytic murein transglycosylase B [Lacisediminimonas profundi]